MSNSGKIWDIREAYKKQRANQWIEPGNVGLYAGGQTPSNTNTVEQINISTNGDATDFGDLTESLRKLSMCGGHVRVVRCGGQTPSNVNTMDFANPFNAGNFVDFGDLTQTGMTSNTGHSNNIRGLNAQGQSTTSANIDTFILTSTGNASSFGDATRNMLWSCGGGNNTRYLTAGHYGAPAGNNVIDIKSIDNDGNSVDFGDLSAAKWGVSQASDPTRVCFSAGNAPGLTTDIEFVSIATAGNVTDFGDLTAATGDSSTASNSKRAVVQGQQSPSNSTHLDVFIIQTTGNATEYGDLSVAQHQCAGASNGHGGIPQTDQFPQRPSVNYMPGSGRGLVQKVGTPFNANVSYIHIPTSGNSVDFGDMTQSRNYAAGASSLTRGIAGGGSSPSAVNTIDYTEMASRGNYADFGDLSVTRARPAGNVGSTTRALFSGGDTPTKSDVIDYITMASVGNATDFGNLTVARTDAAGGLSSATRGVVGGGATPSDAESNVIDYVTISSTGNSTDFGDMSVGRSYLNGVSSSTRGVFSSGLSVPSSPYGGAVIDYITIASTGNATDFGDPTQNRYGPAGMSNSIRGVFAGGRLAPNDYNIIDFITIASTGNAADFGDLSETGECLTAASDNHGGLQA